MDHIQGHKLCAHLVVKYLVGVHCESVEGKWETCQGSYQAQLPGTFLEKNKSRSDGWMDG